MNLNIRKRYSAAGVIQGLIVSVIAFLIILSLLESTSLFGIEVAEVSNFFAPDTVIIIIAIAGAAIITRNKSIGVYLKKRKKLLVKKSFELGMHPSSIKLPDSLLNISEDKFKYRDQRTSNSYIGDNWGYGEYEFSRYRTIKNSTYNTATFYFAIGVFSLPRKLPNVFFDSHQTGGREFQLLFDSAQKHSLESVFDDYFTSYFHEDYTIDNLSFITPEVMESLISASEYDIEIYQDRLYIYNELENMPKQLEDMQQKGNLIREKLLNNIITYRDDRVRYSEGRSTVSMLGVSLKRSILTFYVRLMSGIVMLVVLLVMLILSMGTIFNSLYIIALAISIGVVLNNGRKIKNIIQEESEAAHSKSLGA